MIQVVIIRVSLFVCVCLPYVILQNSRSLNPIDNVKVFVHLYVSLLSRRLVVNDAICVLLDPLVSKFLLTPTKQQGPNRSSSYTVSKFSPT